MKATVSLKSHETGSNFDVEIEADTREAIGVKIVGECADRNAQAVGMVITEE